MIFCFGGVGISFEEDASESSESASESESDSGSGLDFDLEGGWEVWNRLSDEGRVSGSVARSFPFPFDFFEDDAFA